MPKVVPMSIPRVKVEGQELTEVEEQLMYEINKAISKIEVIFQQYASAINNLKLVDNIGGEKISVEFSTAGTELTETHTLGRTPLAIIGMKVDRPGAIYLSQVPTSTNLYLKSDTDSLSGDIYII